MPSREPAVRIASVATAVPPFAMEQQNAGAYLEEHFGARLTPRSRTVLRQVFAHPSVRKRHFAIEDPASLIDEDPDRRVARFTRWAVDLSEQAARKALGQIGLAPADVSRLVVNTCTGYLCPGIATYLIERLGLRARHPRARPRRQRLRRRGGRPPTGGIAPATPPKRAEERARDALRRRGNLQRHVPDGRRPQPDRLERAVLRRRGGGRAVGPRGLARRGGRTGTHRRRQPLRPGAPRRHPLRPQERPAPQPAFDPAPADRPGADGGTGAPPAFGEWPARRRRPALGAASGRRESHRLAPGRARPDRRAVGPRAPSSPSTATSPRPPSGSCCGRSWMQASPPATGA